MKTTKKTTPPPDAGLAGLVALIDARAEQLLGAEYRRKLGALAADAWGKDTATAEQTLSHWRRRAERGEPAGRDIRATDAWALIQAIGGRIDWGRRKKA